MFYKALGNGKYRFYQKYYHEEKGKWLQVSVTKNSKSRAVQAQVQKQLYEKIENILNGTQIVKQDCRIKDVCWDWLNIRSQEVKESTFKIQEIFMLNFFKSFENQRLSSIQSAQLQRYILEKNWSKGYMKLVKAILRLFFEYCKKVGYIETNPVDSVVLPKRKKTILEIKQQREKYLTRSEFMVFLDYLKSKKLNGTFTAFIEFMYLTGLRYGEAAALQWKDVDVENQFLTISHTIQFRSDGTYYLSSPKTITAYRKVYFNKRILEILEQLRDLSSGDASFIFLFKGKPIKNISINSFLKSNFLKCSVSKDKDFVLTSHVLRHSYISLLAELNVPIKVVMEQVGHADEKVTLSIYTHVTENMRDNFKEKLELIQ